MRVHNSMKSTVTVASLIFWANCTFSCYVLSFLSCNRECLQNTKFLTHECEGRKFYRREGKRSNYAEFSLFIEKNFYSKWKIYASEMQPQVWKISLCLYEFSIGKKDFRWRETCVTLHGSTSETIKISFQPQPSWNSIYYAEMNNGKGTRDVQRSLILSYALDPILCFINAIRKFSKWNFFVKYIKCIEWCHKCFLIFIYFY